MTVSEAGPRTGSSDDARYRFFSLLLFRHHRYSLCMSLHLYNTLTKKEEEFTPINEGKVSMYTCGPTVYGRPHIGNYSSFLMADLLRRWLTVSGYSVTHVKNITDVGHLVADAEVGEDKIEKQAKAERIDPLQIAKKYANLYLEDERILNFIEPEHRPLATETIPEMLTIIRELIKKGHAYETEDGIYFDVHSKTPTPYGTLSGNTLDNLESGARVSVDEKKKHPADFALWKKCVGHNSPHLLRWNFATGERVHTEGEDPSAGFPGWHIECSAMSTKFLGEQIDIHTGGEDNIFPHHECEIAQSEAFCGKKPFVRHWLHRRRIDIASKNSAQGAEKMSKSLGNVLCIPDIIEMGYSPMDLRYYLLSVHYRTNLKFTEKGLDDARKARKKIVEWISELSTAEKSSSTHPSIQEYESRFHAAMNADLNTPEALATIFDVISYSRKENLLGACTSFARMIEDTFGCFAVEEVSVPSEVLALVSERETARKNKDFAASDAIRDKIYALGYEVKDTSEGQKVTKL